MKRLLHAVEERPTLPWNCVQCRRVAEASWDLSYQLELTKNYTHVYLFLVLFLSLGCSIVLKDPKDHFTIASLVSLISLEIKREPATQFFLETGR